MNNVVDLRNARDNVHVFIPVGQRCAPMSLSGRDSHVWGLWTSALMPLCRMRAPAQTLFKWEISPGAKVGSKSKYHPFVPSSHPRSSARWFGCEVESWNTVTQSVSWNEERKVSPWKSCCSVRSKCFKPSYSPTWTRLTAHFNSRWNGPISKWNNGKLSHQRFLSQATNCGTMNIYGYVRVVRLLFFLNWWCSFSTDLLCLADLVNSP